MARFEGFGGFGVFEAFEGSIRQLRASRKRKTWLATAPSLAAEKGPLSLPEPVVWQFQEPERKTWLATAPSLAAEKEPLGLPEPVVWQFQEPARKTWQLQELVGHVLRGLEGLAVPRAGKKDLVCHSS